MWLGGAANRTSCPNPTVPTIPTLQANELSSRKRLTSNKKENIFKKNKHF